LGLKDDYCVLNPKKASDQGSEGQGRPRRRLALPRKAIEAIRGVSLSDSKKELPKESLIKRYADDLRTESLEEAWGRCEKIIEGVTNENPTFSSTVPVVLEPSNGKRIELVGSGVLIRILDRVFLLIAAHVMDRFNDGELLIPGNGRFIPLTGSVGAMKLPPSGDRADDRFDVAYCWLSPECAEDLDPSCLVLDRDDVDISSKAEPRTSFTFAGYPWRKSAAKNGRLETRLTTFSGVEADSDIYEAFGLNRTTHLIIRFNREKAFHSGQNQMVTASLPHGMSGGGAYVWSKDALKKWPVRLPLAGIVTDVVRANKLLIATRLSVFVNCIFHNQPDLDELVGNSAARRILLSGREEDAV
jgi:hypothetical protein